MLVLTAKLTRKKLITGIIAAGIVAFAIVLVKGGGENIGAGKFDDNDNKNTISIENVNSHEDRIKALESLGWQVKEDPLEFMEVQIPEEFDEVYSEYNNIQISQGMDLKKYAGKRAMRYSYQILNYPTGEAGIIANILVYKNKLIGGDVCSPQLNGFMHGLLMPDRYE